MRELTKQRLFGFGPIGWVGVAALLGLVGVVVRGVDVQDVLLVWITNTFGIDATYWFVPRWMGASSMALWSAQFSLLTAALLSVALFLSCRGLPPRVYLLIWAMALVWPALTWELRVWLSSAGMGSGLSRFLVQFLFANVPLIVLALMSRRMWVWVCASVAYGIGGGATYGPDLTLAHDPRGSYVFWIDAWWIAFNTLILTTLVVWARRHWRPWDDASLCSACGYELTGLGAGGTCPECGGSVSPAL